VTGAVPARRAFSSIAVGDELTPLVVDVTATVIAAGAIATRDFMPVHHDRDYAQAQGAPDIFMNILSSNAFCSRFLTDWAGPEAFVRKLSIRLGVSVHPGSVLTFAGTVTGTSVDGEEGVVHVEFTATNDLGAHVTGTATLTLPLD
jgi:acyl dehydratase